MELASSVVLGVVSSLVSAVLFLLVVSRLRPRIEISEVIAHTVVHGRALDRYAVKVRNATRAQLLDVRIKASFSLHHDPTHPRVGRGTQLEFEYPTLFDLARSESKSGGSGRSTFEFTFRTPLQPMLAMSDDWSIRIAISSVHSVSGLGAIAKRNILGSSHVMEGSFAPGVSLSVVDATPVTVSTWRPTAGSTLDEQLVADLLARVSALGSRLAEADRTRLVTFRKGDEFDVVTDADVDSERRLGDILRDLFPEDGVIGEELLRIPSRSGATWVVDPIDGTVNYIQGERSWGISLARRVEGQVVLCLLVFPELRETYFAVRGGGAFRNGEPLKVSSKTDLGSSVIATRFGMVIEDRRSEQRALIGLLEHARDIRRTGCTTLDLAQVAAGVFDGYLGRGLGEWDSAAGSLLIEESAGSWSNWAGTSDLAAGDFVAGNETLLAELSAIARGDDRFGTSPFA